MRTIRSILLVPFLFGFFFLVACGGGGSSGASAGTAVVAGQVVLRNGTTQNLGGVQISLTGLGVTTTSASDGTFSFGSVPTGNLAVAVSDPLAPLAAGLVTTEDRGADDGPGHDEGSGGGATGGPRNDDDGDAHDVGDGDFDVPSVGDAESVSITISVRNGKIESVDICHHGSGGHDEGRVALSRTVESDDADAEGSAKLESRVDNQKLSVEVENLTAGRSLEAFVISKGVAQSIGKATVDAAGEARWEIATKNGGVLPFGAATVADLAGDDVEVRDALAGTVLLRGTLPEVKTPTAAAGGTTTGSRSHGRSALVATTGNTGSGHIELCRRVETVLQNKFQVELDGLASGLAVEVWMENAVGSGVFAKIGSMTVGALGRAELELDSHDGDAMPFGVLDVADLVGRGVQVRKASDGTVILTGTVPALVSEK